MKFIAFNLLILVHLTATHSEGQEISIIPAPVQLEVGSGAFHLTERTIIGVPANRQDMTKVAEYLVSK